MSRGIKIGIDFSIMQAPIQVIRNLKLPYDHKFICEFPQRRATIKANFPHGIMYDDVTTRDNSMAPATDLYVAGFPIQPFGAAGLGRGEIFFYVLDYIAKQKPRAFILENVSGIIKLNGGSYKNDIMEELNNLGLYNIKDQVLITKEHGGTPVNSRRRWYCVGILKSVDDGSFSFPKPLPLTKRPKIEAFLEMRNRDGTWTLEEMMRLQGMDPTKFRVAVTEDQLREQLQMTTPVNVLERLMVRVLPAAKLVQHRVLADRWQSGQAV